MSKFKTQHPESKLQFTLLLWCGELAWSGVDICLTTLEYTEIEAIRSKLTILYSLNLKIPFDF